MTNTAEYTAKYNAKNAARLTKYRQAYYLKHKKRWRHGERARYQQNPARYLFLCARRNAGTRNLRFSIKESDIKIPKCCPLLGVKLAPVLTNSLYIPSVDRKNSALGYVPGNVWVISWRANAIKRDATPQELRKIAASLRRLRIV